MLRGGVFMAMRMSSVSAPTTITLRLVNSKIVCPSDFAGRSVCAHAEDVLATQETPSSRTSPMFDERFRLSVDQTPEMERPGVMQDSIARLSREPCRA